MLHMFSLGLSSGANCSGKMLTVVSPLPVHTTPFAATLRTSKVGYFAAARRSTIWSLRPTRSASLPCSLANAS